MSLPQVISGNIGAQAVGYVHLADDVRNLLLDVIYTAENKESQAFIPGQPVARHSSGSGVWLAVASSLSRTGIGLAITATAPGFPATIQTEGRVTLDDWTPITGTLTLAALADYYLTTTAGQLATLPPTAGGTLTQRIGKAISSTTLQLALDVVIRN